jgi:hypothetical protein
MSKVRIELDHSGVKALLHSKELAEYLKGVADDMAERCGEGYGSDYKHMASRVIASAYADTQEARKDNIRNNTLLKAVKG